MATNSRFMKCTPEQVFRVLADGWLYPSWVVGASRVRGVDAGFPTPGSHIHHSFGVWPLLINDATEVKKWDAPARVELKARAWPSGEADVIIEVQETTRGCKVRIQEDAVAGPALLIPFVLRNAGIFWRNRESLRRLAFLAEGGAAERLSA